MPARSAMRWRGSRGPTGRRTKRRRRGWPPTLRRACSMAELGETQDARALVPGDPDAIAENAAALRARAKAAGDAGDGLRSIDTGSWSGAAAQRFHEKFSYEPGKWFTAADAMQAGAGSLDDYVSTLRWAQGQAAEAIRLWDQGEAATRTARAAYESAARQAEAAQQSLPPFSDPGEADRSQAQTLLATARTQVDSAGRTAAGTLRDKASLAPEKSSWLDDVGDFVHDVGGHVVNGFASVGNAM